MPFSSHFQGVSSPISSARIGAGMSIIIAGALDFPIDQAERAIVEGRQFIEASLKEPGCIYYAWTLDPLTPGRVYVLEEWTSQTALEGHFADASYWGMRNHLQNYGLIGSSVKKYRFDLSERVYDDEGKPRADFFTTQTA
jgi:quinol monooxygenase YgiN